MKEGGVAGPKEVFLGLPRPGYEPLTGASNKGEPASAEDWALFNWVGVSKTGGTVLGGGDPISEGLCPKGSLSSMQPFRVAPSTDAWRRLAAKCGGGAPFAALAL